MNHHKKVELYWDLGSTNTYFALKLIEPILKRTGAMLELHPFNVGFVFRANNYVLMEEPRIKLRNRLQDLQRWAIKYALPFRMPDKFPIKTSRALRTVLVMKEHGLESAFIGEIFAAYWEQNDASIETYDGLSAIAQSLGVSATELVDRAESEEIRNQLIDSTNQGIERGVFGVPSIFVGEEMFWGKDRMEFVEDALVNAN